jgi:hypothetical protein
MKLYENCIRFVKIVIIIIPDDHMTEMKVVGLENLWNFVIERFLIWISFVNEKYMKTKLIVSNLEFKFCKLTWMEKLIIWKLCISRIYEALYLTTF